MVKETKAEIRRVIREGVTVYSANGLEIRPVDVCRRTFSVYVGNENVDKSRNTEQGKKDVAICAKYLDGYCYKHFAGGQMEQVLDELVAISYIATPMQVRETIDALRGMGVNGRISVFVEYMEGDLLFLYDDSYRLELPRKMEMKLTKAQVSTLNEIAQNDFKKAQAMLEGVNMVLGTQYGWLASRVVWFENPNGTVAERYAHVHDAWAE